MGQPPSSDDENAAGAEALYEEVIRGKVEPENIGKFLVIDIRTGDYVMDAQDVTAMKRAVEKHPNGVFYLMRIGDRVLGRIGGPFTRTGA